MTTGLVWFDASKGKSLEEKVSEAVSAYRLKPRFGQRDPDTCYVHPSTVSATVSPTQRPSPPLPEMVFLLIFISAGAGTSAP